MTPTQAFNAFKDNLPKFCHIVTHDHHFNKWIDVVWNKDTKLQKESLIINGILDVEGVTKLLSRFLEQIKQRLSIDFPDETNPPDAG